jgi:hypothetical protein
MPEYAYPISAVGGNSAVPWPDHTRRVMAPIDAAATRGVNVNRPVRSARPIFGAVSGFGFVATDLGIPERRLGTVHVPSGEALPTADTESAAISKTTDSWRDAARADLWARIIRFCHEAAQHQSDAKPVASATLENARRLLIHLPMAIELPQATVSSEAEIILTWFRGSDRLDAILDPETHLTWVFRIGNSIEDGGDVALSEARALDDFFASVAQFYA